jgi:hypothetical protein
VDATAALADLTRLSEDIEHAAIVDADGELAAATPGAPAGRLARAAGELFRLAVAARPGASVDRVEVALAGGSVVAVRRSEHVAIAIARPESAPALVVHDLRACLDAVAPPVRRRGGRKGAADA